MMLMHEDDKLEIFGRLYEKPILRAIEGFSGLSQYLTKRELEISSPARKRIIICPYLMAEIQRLFNDLNIDVDFIITEKGSTPTSVGEIEVQAANGKHYQSPEKRVKSDDA